MTQLDLGFAGDVGFVDVSLIERYAFQFAHTPKANVVLSNVIEPTPDDIVGMAIVSAWKLEQRVLIVGDRSQIREKVEQTCAQLGIPLDQLRVADDKLGVIVEQARD